MGGVGGGGGSHVARKTSRVGVYKCLSLIVGSAVTVAIWPREVVSCRDFISRAVATFWAMSLVGIYLVTLAGPLCHAQAFCRPLLSAVLFRKLTMVLRYPSRREST